MQIVNFQCGKCGKLMGISAEHLGTQVHCPHCHEIVEAPRPAPPPDPYADVHVDIPDSKEQESIFTHPEDEQGDDLFGGPAKPLVELPPESAPRHAVEREPRSPREMPEPDRGAFAARPAATMPETIEAPSDHGANALPAPPVPKSAKSGMLGPMMLVLLIPYSLLTTIYIIWTFLSPSHDPFQYLRDPGKDGNPRRVSPDSPLPGKLKTSLQRPIRVGVLELTPLKVEMNREGDLVLLLKMTNISTDQAFRPVDHSYLLYAETSRKTPRPYSYLDAGAQGKLQGGYLRFLKLPTDKEEDTSKGVIRPGQEVYVELTTLDKYRGAKMKSVMQSARPLVWRVHFRRGLVAVGGRDVSATAVIGVEFSPSAVEKAKA